MKRRNWPDLGLHPPGAVRRGDLVAWETVGAGKVTRRSGRVVELVRAGRRPRSRLADPGSPRSADSCVVRCGETGALYWPRVVRPLAATSGPGHASGKADR